MTEKSTAEIFYPTDEKVEAEPHYMDALLAEEKAERDKVEATQAAKDNAGVKAAVADAIDEKFETQSDSMADALIADAKLQMAENQETFSAEELSTFKNYIETEAPELGANPLIADPNYIKSTLALLAQRKET